MMNDNWLRDEGSSTTKQTRKETAVITTTAHEARPRRLTNTLLWMVQILLAAFFVFVAVLPKLTGGGSHGAVQEFAAIGAGQWFRYFVGTVELAGAIGLLTPWLAGLAAAGLAADMAGATIVNATVLNGTRYDALGLTVLLFAVFVILAYGRRQQLKSLVAAIRRSRAATGSGAEAEPSLRASASQNSTSADMRIEARNAESTASTFGS